MFLKKIDILSPQITLYNKELLYHTSLISIILSIISFAIIAICSFIYVVLYLFNIEIPNMTSYNYYLEKFGTYTIYNSSFFHFINLKKDIHNPTNQEFDFESFIAIGFETYLEDYINNRNLSLFNHWLYGRCSFDNYTENFKDLINQEYFNKSACIKKYYDSNKGEYYDIDNPNFRWPVLSHGIVNEGNKYYSIIIEKCEEYTLNQILKEEGLKCKKEIDENILRNGSIAFYFPDQYFYLENYTNPILYYLNKIEGKLYMHNYLVNHIYFTPFILKTTSGGIITQNISIDISYSFDKNDKCLYQNEDNKTYTGYYLLLNNKIDYMERRYSGLTDVMSNIGGTSQVIISIFIFINKIFNRYSMLLDTKKLFSSSSSKISIRDIMDKRKEIKLKNIKSNNYNINKTSSSIKNIKNIPKLEKNTFHSFNKITENNKVSSEIENVNNLTFINEKSYKCEDTNIIENKETVGNIFNINSSNKNEKISFCNFFIYKISLGKIYKSFNLYEQFRIKIISVENLMKTYLIYYN